MTHLDSTSTRLLSLALLLLTGCSEQGATSGPPLGQLYFPAGIAHVDVPGKTEGVLFVANANLDKRYGTGSIVALQLDGLGLPALGTDRGTISRLYDLKLTETQAVQIASFAGELAVQPVGANEYRLFTPTRSEGMRVYRTRASIGADGTPTLSCEGATGQDCVDTGTSLSPRQFEQSDAGVPRAPSPYGVAVAPRACAAAADCCPLGVADCGRTCTASQCVGTDGFPFADVWVTHLSQADSPLSSNTNFRGYLVRLDSDAFTAGLDNFFLAGGGGSNSIVSAGNWVYASGRFLSPAPNLIRLANKDGTVVLSSVESNVRVGESRGLALSSDKKRLFVLGRFPDSLLTFQIVDGVVPTLNVIGSTTLPDGPNEVRVIARPGRGDLLVITCTNSLSVALYDEDVGNVVSLIGGVGVQPYGLAVDERGGAARIYVSNFGDGRISVIDVPDVNRPQGAHLVARLGKQQLCLTRGASSPGCVASQAEEAQ